MDVIRPECGLSFVQPVNTNENPLTRTIEREDVIATPVTPSEGVQGEPAPPAARTAAAARTFTPFEQCSEEARAVLDEWRRAHGKRSPPKLNPTQAAKLETAVADLGVERLKESAVWSAERGIPEFDKCLRAAYTKRQHDEAAEQEPVIGGRNGISAHAKPVSAAAKYDRGG